MSQRNIPACAGKTIPATTFTNNAWEHPRVRGENFYLKSPLILALGTSPRARGKLAPGVNYYTSTRNIPACAGKTIKEAAQGLSEPEHPRVRGENMHQDARQGIRPGTSPRARGKPG